MDAKERSVASRLGVAESQGLFYLNGVCNIPFTPGIVDNGTAAENWQWYIFIALFCMECREIRGNTRGGLPDLPVSLFRVIPRMPVEEGNSLKKE